MELRLVFYASCTFSCIPDTHKFGYNCTDLNRKDQQQLYQNK
jgi:hypothetical protein